MTEYDIDDEEVFDDEEDIEEAVYRFKDSRALIVFNALVELVDSDYFKGDEDNRRLADNLIHVLLETPEVRHAESVVFDITDRFGGEVRQIDGEHDPYFVAAVSADKREEILQHYNDDYAVIKIVGEENGDVLFKLR